MQLLAHSLLMVLLGWLLRGALAGRWKRNPKYHRLSDLRHCWVEVGGKWHAFTDDALGVARDRANALNPKFPHRWRSRVLWVVLGGSLLFMLTGCGVFGGPKIKSGGTTVSAPKDTGKPATLETNAVGTSVSLPQGSTVRVTKIDAIAAKPASAGVSEVKAEPAKEVTEIMPAGPAEYRKTENTVSAQTGTIDTTVATHRIDVAERRWLLWAAIGCGIGGLVLKSMMPSWPALSNGLLLGAVFAGLAWKLADIPSWIWLVAIGIVSALALGYKRAEWDKNGDGVPDFLQSKPPTQ